MANPKFKINKTKDDQFRFNLTAKNGQVILSSESYTTKSACMNGVESVRKNSSDDSHFDRQEASNGQVYFNLRAGNNQTIGKSELYTTKSSMENGIESVKSNAPIADIDDLT